MPRFLMFLTLAAWAFLGPASHADAQPPAQGKIPILLDCDIGDDIDDTFALALVLASPELDLRGVTTVWDDSYKRAQIVCRFLTAVGHKAPVAAGLPGKTTKPLPYWQVQYGNHASVYFRDPKPAKIIAHEFLYQHLKGKPGELTIIAVGPLTNIARLLTEHPDCKPMIKQIVLMGGSVRRGYGDGSKPQAEYNIVQDIKSAQVIFRSGVPLVVAPLDATALLRLDARRQKRLYDAGSLLTLSVQALVQLWQEKNEPVMFDPVAVTLAYTEKFCTMENLALDVDDKGFTKIVQDGKPNAREATAVRKDEFLDWFSERLASAYPKSLPSGRVVNEAKMVPRGLMPNRVHAFEDYETDIEKRWWLAGRTTATPAGVEILPEQCRINAVQVQDVSATLGTFFGVTKAPDSAMIRDALLLKIRNAQGQMVPVRDLVKVQEPGQRALRGVLTQDFDDRQGEMKTLYTGVVFNPVPGPPMGKRPHLSFRYFLKGADTLRVQIYSLTNGYHRCLTLTGLPQGKWQDGNVNMQDSRKPDGTGGPLSENERIDDIQFYADPRAELLIDDIVLYDTAVEGEKRPFPRRILFTGLFDTGKQGKEWPGEFAIATNEGFFGNAAKSVPCPDDKAKAWIKLGVRGDRPVGAVTNLFFRYKIEGANSARLLVSAEPKSVESDLELKQGSWNNIDVPVLTGGTSVRALTFRVPAAARLWIDDLLLYEPGKSEK